MTFHIANHKYLKFDQVYHSPQIGRQARLRSLFERDMERSDVVMLKYNTPSRLAKRETKKEDIPPQILALMRDPVEGNLEDIL